MAIGRPLMPWQRLVADVALEHEDGALAYTWSIVSVGRQNGKTILVLVIELDRLSPLGMRVAGVVELPGHDQIAPLWRQPQRAAYTAQDGTSARRKLLEDQVPLLEADTVHPFVRRQITGVRRSSGDSGLSLAGGSRLRVLNTTATAGRGETLDLAMLDEAMAHADDALEGALLPTMVTRRNHQLWVTSNVGTDAARYLAEKHALGRAFVEAGRTDTVAFFHWGAGDDDDPGSPATWAAAMPAYGITITEAAMRARWEAASTSTEGVDTFKREYLNVWTANTVTAIPLTLWNDGLRLELGAGAGADVPVAFAVEVDLDRTVATIAGAWPVAGGVAVGIVDRRPGTDWLPDRLADLERKYFPVGVAVDGAGPAFAAIPPRAPIRDRMMVLGAREVAAAAGSFHDALLSPAGVGVFHDDDADLLAAVTNVRRKPAAGSWLFDRRAVPYDASAVVAAVLARYALTAAPGAPVVRSG